MPAKRHAGSASRSAGPRLGGDPAASVQGLVEPAAVGVAQQHVGPAVAVQVAQAGEAPVRVGGQVHQAAVREHAPPVHGVVAPAAVPAVAQEDVGPAVAVDVADAGEAPVRVRRQAAQGAAAGGDAGAVHRVVAPAPVLVAEQHVVPAVAAEVADAGEAPCGVRREVRRFAVAGQRPAAVHRVAAPASVLVAQEDVVPAVAVEVAEAAEAPREVARQVRGAPAGDGAPPVHGVVVPASVGVAEQHVVVAVAVEVAETLQLGKGRRRERGRREDDQDRGARCRRTQPAAFPASRLASRHSSVRCSINDVAAYQRRGKNGVPNHVDMVTNRVGLFTETPWRAGTKKTAPWADGGDDAQPPRCISVDALAGRAASLPERHRALTGG